VNDQANPGLPVRTWRDLWGVIVVIALIVGTFTVNQFETRSNSADIQELKQVSERKDVLDPQIDRMQKQLDRIEGKLDAAAQDRSAH
jgi:hypothetical protein